VYPSLWSYYLLQRFHWSALLIGLSLALTGAMVMLGQGFVLGKLVERIGERKTIIVGAVSTIIAFLGYAFATQSWMIFALSLLDLVSFMVIPSLTALISERAKADEQGYIQGVVASLNGLTLVIGPLLSTKIFAWSTTQLHNIFAAGTAFILAALLCSIALCLILLEKSKTVSLEHNLHSP